VTAADLARPLGLLLLIMACCAAVSGIVGYLLARKGLIELTETMASAVPAESHARFVADWWTHLASYLVGFLGGIVLIAMTWRKRRRVSGDRTGGHCPPE
jgi:hypothetical protein